MKRFGRLLIVACLAAGLSCGDGSFIFAFSTGTIDADPICDGGGGRFDLRQQGGLVIVVAIESDTTIILAGGGGGTCGDLRTGLLVDVRGTSQGDQIVASNIVVN